MYTIVGNDSAVGLSIPSIYHPCIHPSLHRSIHLCHLEEACPEEPSIDSDGLPRDIGGGIHTKEGCHRTHFSWSTHPAHRRPVQDCFQSHRIVKHWSRQWSVDIPRSYCINSDAILRPFTRHVVRHLGHRCLGHRIHYPTADRNIVSACKQ